MLNIKNKFSTFKSIFVILSALILLGGCALGVTEVKVKHAPLKEVSTKREGSLLLKKFVDSRIDTEHIGNKRNGFGMVLGHIGLHGDIKLDSLLTQYFSGALQEAGYKVTICDEQSENDFSKAEFDAIIEGEIITFWMDLYMAVWHRVGVNIRAINPTDEKLLWEGLIEGAENRVLWVGATGEYERIIREALTKALNRALEEFTSDEFYKSLTP